MFHEVWELERFQTAKVTLYVSILHRVQDIITRPISQNKEVTCLTYNIIPFEGNISCVQ